VIILSTLTEFIFVNRFKSWLNLKKIYGPDDKKGVSFFLEVYGM
jgi:hypothetical protein